MLAQNVSPLSSEMARRHCAQSALATQRRSGRTSAAGPVFLAPWGRLPAGEAVSVFAAGPTIGHCHSDQLIAIMQGGPRQRRGRYGSGSVSRGQDRRSSVNHRSRGRPSRASLRRGHASCNQEIRYPSTPTPTTSSAHDVRIFEMDALAHTPLARKPITLSGAFSCRRMVAGPQTDRRGKAGDPRSLRSRAPAFPFSLRGVPWRSVFPRRPACSRLADTAKGRLNSRAGIGSESRTGGR
jgi:hypothetical protein